MVRLYRRLSGSENPSRASREVGTGPDVHHAEPSALRTPSGTPVEP
jgi:hypothetical protein